MQVGDVSIRFCALGLKGVSFCLGLQLRLELRPELYPGFRPGHGESVARYGGLLLVLAAAFDAVAGAVLGRCAMP